jgi:tyrosine/nicotianamine family aminotransferase
MISASNRAQKVEYAIRDIMVKAEEVQRAGKKLIPLNIGDPVKYGFDTPSHVKKVLTKAVESGSNFYSASEGIRELRESIAAKENGINGAHIDPDHVIVTSGISEAILFLMESVVNPSDEILVPGPCYPPYLTYVKFFDGKAVTYRTIEDKGWAPDVADLEAKINSRTRLIVIVNPNNPCGSVYSKHEIAKIIDIAAANNLPIAADEIYDRIVYDGEFTSVASIAKDVPILGLNGFSKTYLMTGWRLGYLFVQDPNRELSAVWEGIQRLSRVRLCAATPVQIAGVEALRGPQDHIPKMVGELKRRRDYAWNRVNSIPGLHASKPAGAFYLFPRVDLNSRWKDDAEFTTALLKETGVLVVNGSGFDPCYGKDHFRAVFLPPEEMLREALNAIETYMKKNSS